MSDSKADLTDARRQGQRLFLLFLCFVAVSLIRFDHSAINMSRLLCLLLIVTGTVMASPTLPPELHDDVHGVKMGVVHEDCDDAKVKSGH